MATTIMDAGTQDYISKRLETQINYYSRKALYNQRLFKALSICTMVLSALIPVIAILSELNNLSARILLGVLGSGITLLAGILNLNRHQELWASYRITCERLMREKILYEYAVGQYANLEGSEKMNILIGNCEMIMNDEHNQWLDTSMSNLSSGSSSSTGS